MAPKDGDSLSVGLVGFDEDDISSAPREASREEEEEEMGASVSVGPPAPKGKSLTEYGRDIRSCGREYMLWVKKRCSEMMMTSMRRKAGLDAKQGKFDFAVILLMARRFFILTSH